MPGVFISYSAEDNELAKKLYTELAKSGAEPFLAELNLLPGGKWKDEIFARLKESQWVFFLATPNSCKSQAVAHEIGASLALEKKFIPLMWKVAPKDLPQWGNDRQAIDLEDRPRLSTLIGSVGAKVKSDKFWTGIVVAGLIAFALWLLSKKE